MSHKDPASVDEWAGMGHASAASPPGFPLDGVKQILFFHVCGGVDPPVHSSPPFPCLAHPQHQDFMPILINSLC